jgi:hypothetical protein
MVDEGFYTKELRASSYELRASTARPFSELLYLAKFCNPSAEAGTEKKPVFGGGEPLHPSRPKPGPPGPRRCATQNQGEI